MYKLLISIAVLCVSAFSPVTHAKDWDIKQILVLHSYEPSYQWTADFQKGIENAFKHSKAEIKLSVEYLDTKRIHSPEYYDALAAYFETKYSEYKFDGVIVTDDNAANFLKSLSSVIVRHLLLLLVSMILVLICTRSPTRRPCCMRMTILILILRLLRN